MEQPSKRPPYPKRKVAIMMGYCGTNYQGMQLYGVVPTTMRPHMSLFRNPNAKTIELELFKALCQDGLVSADNAVDPKKASAPCCCVLMLPAYRLPGCAPVAPTKECMPPDR